RSSAGTITTGWDSTRSPHGWGSRPMRRRRSGAGRWSASRSCWGRAMTPDEIPPIDESLLAALLAADAARAEGHASDLAPGADPSPSTPADLPGFLELIQRLEAYEPESAATPAPAAPAETPISLGRFEVVRELGQGGFGVVYLARDPVLGREVALKVPRAE